MADYPALVTVLDRLLSAGLARHVAERHLRYGRVRVDGAVVTDPNAPAEPPARITLHPTVRELAA